MSGRFMRIAVLANLRQNAPATRPREGASPLPSDAWAELDSESTVEAIVGALERGGHQAAFFEGDLSLVERLPRYSPELCFNLCEGHTGDSRESHVPALLEMLGLPYSGAGVLALAVTLDKPLCKRLLLSHGLRTPPFQVFVHPDERLDPSLEFPLFVKPSHEGSGMGVCDDSVVRSEAQLRRKVTAILEVYREPALVERFIRGREISVGLLGNPHDASLRVLPTYEILLPGGDGEAVYSQQRKSNVAAGWAQGQQFRCPAPVDPAIEEELRALAMAAFVATGCRDLGRVDFRLDADDRDRPFLLEVNALPGLAPGWGDIVCEAACTGLSYDALILGIVEAASSRLRAGATRGAPSPLRGRW